jgi:hypothetical protein
VGEKILAFGRMLLRSKSTSEITRPCIPDNDIRCGFFVTVLFPQLQGKCQGKNLQRLGTARTLPYYLLFWLFGCYLCCSVYCLCVNVYCHRVTTQLQLINISYYYYLDLLQCLFALSCELTCQAAEVPVT